MKNIGTLVLPLLFFTAQLYSQKMVAGYILTEEGDSLAGYIRNHDIKNYKDSLLFRQTVQKGKSVFYSVKNCKGFGSFKPSVRYERWKTTIDISYFDKNYYLINADSTITEVYFLKNIYEGSNISLYYYKDDNSKEHYFVKYAGTMEELIQKFRKPSLIESVTPGKSPNYVIVFLFRDQLYKYFDWQKNGKLKSKVDFAEYFYPTMIAIIKAIDNEKSESN